MNKKILSTLATVGLTLSMGMAGAGAVEASGNVSPDGLCNGGTPDIAVSNVSRAYVPGTKKASGSPGGTVSIQVGDSTTTTGTISASATAEAGIIFARASATAGVSLSQSGTVTSSISYSAVIPAQGGYLELGSEGRQFNFTSTTYNNNCVVIDQFSGSGKGATSTPYFFTSWGGFV